MSPLAPCPECPRHVRVAESICSFCGSEVSLEAEVRMPQRRLGRAALFAFGATLAAGLATAGCSDDDEGGQGGAAGTAGSGGTSGSSGASGSGGASGSAGSAGTAGVGGSAGTAGAGGTASVDAAYGAPPPDGGSAGFSADYGAPPEN